MRLILEVPEEAGPDGDPGDVVWALRPDQLGGDLLALRRDPTLVRLEVVWTGSAEAPPRPRPSSPVKRPRDDSSVPAPAVATRSPL